MMEQNIPLPTSVASVFWELPGAEVQHSDFELGRQIGSGASGFVHLGTQKSTGRRVAIKELFADMSDDWIIGCFLREIRALARLKHPNVVEFLGATATQPYWVITGFVPGKSLFHSRTGQFEI
jgi:serine/threonine protein kinase